MKQLKGLSTLEKLIYYYIYTDGQTFYLLPDLSKILHVDSSALAKAVKKLEIAGYLISTKIKNEKIITLP